MPPRPDTTRDKPDPHEPPAFESDLERHRSGDDEVYGAHGVQTDAPPQPARPGHLSGRRRRPFPGNR